MKQVLAQLPRVNDIPHINRGGCGFVAKALYEQAVKHNKEATIYYIINRRSYNTLAQCKEAFTTSIDSPDHAIVKIGRYYYDSEGKHTKSALTGDGYYLIPVTYDYLIKALAKKRLWNPTFNRRQARTIATILTKDTHE